MKIPEVAMQERDALMWELRKRGLTYEQIGKTMNVSTKTAHRGVQRMGDKVLNRLATDHKSQAALDLDRIDGMIRAIEPAAMGREKMTDADGVEHTLPVSLEAQDRLLKLMAHRDKLLGLSGAKIDINVTGPGVIMPSNEGGPKELSNTEATARDETLDLLRLMTQEGVFDQAMVTEIFSRLGAGEVIDVAEVDKTEVMLALPSGEEEAAPVEAPDWIEVDDSKEWD
mgnify:CR=1 FL=1